MEAVGRLAGGVAHDFNNLLTVINGYSAMLADRVKPDSEAHKEAVEVLNAGTRAAALVAQLLTFSRHQIVNPQVLDMNRLVLDVERMLSRIIGEDVTLKIDLGEDAGCILADRNQLETVLINLATNSRDAMPDGGLLTISTCRVDVPPGHRLPGADVPAGSFVHITVSDTGHGMDTHTQQHIFEPFFTTKEVGKGTGLGLSSAYAAIQKYGGRIVAKSEPGAGTVFSIYLPRCEQPSADKKEVALRARGARGDETVLLVEDDKVVRRLAHDVLVKAGYHVLEASNGGEALELWISELEKVDLVVTDVVMPVMNGLKLAQELRKHRPDLKILFISGHAEDTLMTSSVVGDFSLAFLPKPFPPELLASKVRAVLDSPSAALTMKAS
jgi:CheY-like chemotaxis protein